MDVLAGIKGIAPTTSSLGLFVRNGYAIMETPAIAAIIVVGLQLVFLSYAGTVRCVGYDEAKVLQCIELGKLHNYGCGNAHQIADTVTLPATTLGRGANVNNNKGTNAVVEFLAAAMWYRTGGEEEDLDCEDFKLKPAIKAMDKAFLACSSLPAAVVMVLLALYAGRQPLLRSLKQLGQIVSPDATLYDDWLEEAKLEIISAGYCRHFLLSVCYVVTPVLLVAGFLGNFVVLDLAWENHDFIMLVPRTLHFLGVFTGKPLVPLNGWYKPEFFSKTGEQRNYGSNIKNDYKISRDSVFEAPTYDSGLAGTTSMREYWRAMWDLPYMPTPLNNLFPSHLTCQTGTSGPSGTEQLTDAQCSVEGNSGVKDFIFYQHLVVAALVLLCICSFVWRLLYLIPCFRRWTLRRVVPTKGKMSADRLSKHLAFPQWLVLRYYLR